MTPKPIHVYELYGCGPSLSTRATSYGGALWQVAAVSVRQAYYLAGNSVWITPQSPRPTGVIFQAYDLRQGRGRLWCGCPWSSRPLQHMDGLAKICALLNHHTDYCLAEVIW